jgi:uncharacterized pyridoxamine 5'-phosphate oxidase family protein
VANWDAFEQEAPELACVARELWGRHGIMYLATVRTDGSPRVHPVTPLLVDGRIFVATAEQSPKWRDLRHDPRCLLHCLPGERDDEVVMRCRAHEVPKARQTVRAVARHQIHDDDHIIEFDLTQVEVGWWENVGQAGTYSIRMRWEPGRGVSQRPGLRATHT